MTELPLVFVAGLLGVGHCVGMCGPLALALGGTTSSWGNALRRQLAYTSGRVFTYGTLGAIAGYCGSSLVRRLPSLVNVPATLAVAAGILLIYQGLLASGALSRRGVTGASGCLARGFLAKFLHRPRASGAFLAGLFTGFLPCGLLYAMLALAAATHSAALGAATMIVFGFGTAPGLIVVGAGGRLLSLASRRRLIVAAAWCLAVAGALSLARGVSAFAHADPARACPVCSN